MRALTLIRHTKPAVAEGVCYGQSDVPLDENFTREAEQTFRRLCSLSSGATAFTGEKPAISRILTSPSQRCARLAEFFAAQSPSAEIIVQKDARLMELDFGLWEMRSWADIQEQDGEALQNWMEDFVHVAPPHGETFTALQRRALEAIEEYTAQRTAFGSQSLVVVTHAGVLRALAARYAELPLERAFSLAVDFGSISLLRPSVSDATNDAPTFALSAWNC